MNKILYALFFLLLAAGRTGAQAPHIEKSEAFDEPGDGWNKVLQLKNGNTFFLHFSRKNGVEINVYGKDRKLVGTQEVTSDLWEIKKLQYTLIAGLHEINNEVVLFLVQMDGRTPTLYRVRFSGATGAKVADEEMGSLPKIKMFSMGATEANNIFVEKDPASDCYAVIYFNGFANDKDERIRVEHYDGSHKIISKAFYDSPNEDFRYLRYVGCVVDGPNRLYIGTYGARKLNGKEGMVHISRLKAGATAFENKPLKFTEDFKDTKSIMAYNHSNNTIQMLALAFSRGRMSVFGNSARGEYMSLMSYIDPESMDLKSVKPLAGAKVNEYVHRALNSDMNYTGLPQQMVINKDNSTTIHSEMQMQEMTVDQNGNIVSSMTYLGAMGVNELEADGTERAGYAILKNQAAGGLLDPLYISARSNGRWQYIVGAATHNAYISFDYVNTDKGRYIIFNESNKNIDRDEDKRRKVVMNVNKLNTLCYSLNGTTMSKFFLFGEPADDSKSSSCQISTSDFDKNTGTYATVMIEREGRDRSAKIVWVKFE